MRSNILICRVPPLDPEQSYLIIRRVGYLSYIMSSGNGTLFMAFARKTNLLVAEEGSRRVAALFEILQSQDLTTESIGVNRRIPRW